MSAFLENTLNITVHKPFATSLFLYPMKISKNLKFVDDFRGDRKIPGS